jgi:hypothetical protein
MLAVGAALCLALSPSAPARSDTSLAGPYRYCQAPPGAAQAGPPTRVDHNVGVVNGQSPPIMDATSEGPPQGALIAPLGAFAVPPGAVTVRVVIECAPPPAVLPPDGSLDGNVYSFTASAGGTPLSLRRGQQATVHLRGPSGVPHPVLQRYAAGQWMRLDTQPVASVPDTYSATVTDLGEFALVVSSTTVPVAPSDNHTVVVLALFAVAVVLFALGTLVVMRGRTR